MRVNVKVQEKELEMDNVSVVEHDGFFYTHNMIVVKDDCVNVVSGFYNKDANTFNVLDVEKPVYVVKDVDNFSYEVLIDMVDNDALREDYAVAVEFPF